MVERFELTDPCHLCEIRQPSLASLRDEHAKQWVGTEPQSSIDWPMNEVVVLLGRHPAPTVVEVLSGRGGHHQLEDEQLGFVQLAQGNNGWDRSRQDCVRATGEEMRGELDVRWI